jgi:energy-coupling factor transporter ATP-binding protein EcfA2
MKLVEEFFPRTIMMDEGLIVAASKANGMLQDEQGLGKP